MATKIIDINGIVSFDSISSEEDLNLGPRININPLPTDRRCSCCRRHISKLKPFGKAGDPLVGNFDGAFFVKKLRPMGPYDEEAEKALHEAEKCLADAGYKGQDPLEWMIKNYGKKNGEKFYWSALAFYHTGTSLECRDCAVLEEGEYLDKLKERYSNEK